MNALFLRNAIGISLVGHLAFFGACAFSFGPRIPQGELAPVSYWGPLLSSSQVSAPSNIPLGLPRISFARKSPDTSSLDKVRQGSPSELDWRLKPAFATTLQQQKQLFIDAPATLVVSPARRQPVITLHPLLPYGFNLYFQDRQVAHVELMYNIATDNEKSSVMIKRKISSGNLEVDLLVLRYISHYLFVQQASFNPNTWQSVKIDLSAKND